MGQSAAQRHDLSQPLKIPIPQGLADSSRMGRFCSCRTFRRWYSWCHHIKRV